MNIWTILLFFTSICLGQSINNISVLPEYITSNDTVTIYYEYSFGSSPCNLDSTVTYMKNDTCMVIDRYYFVNVLATPCLGRDSIKIEPLYDKKYSVVINVITTDNEFNGTKTIPLEVHSTGFSYRTSHEGNYNAFPNPATNTITLEEIEPNSTLAIYNTLGKEVLRQLATGREETLDISTLPKGLYFITIKTREGKVVTQKFVKE